MIADPFEDGDGVDVGVLIEFLTRHLDRTGAAQLAALEVRIIASAVVAVERSSDIRASAPGVRDMIRTFKALLSQRVAELERSSAPPHRDPAMVDESKL